MPRSLIISTVLIATVALAFFMFSSKKSSAPQSSEKIAAHSTDDPAHNDDHVHTAALEIEPENKQDAVMLLSPYAVATAPNQKNGAAFGILVNATDRDLTVVDIHGDVSQRVEIHEVAMDDGIMKMRKLNALTIPANGESVLEPGGNHIMFMGLKEPLTAQSELSLSLQFMDGTQQEILIPVTPAGQKPSSESMDHHDHNHDHDHGAHGHMDHE